MGWLGRRRDCSRGVRPQRRSLCVVSLFFLGLFSEAQRPFLDFCFIHLPASERCSFRLMQSVWKRLKADSTFCGSIRRGTVCYWHTQGTNLSISSILIQSAC